MPNHRRSTPRTITTDLTRGEYMELMYAIHEMRMRDVRLTERRTKLLFSAEEKLWIAANQSWIAANPNWKNQTLDDETYPTYPAWLDDETDQQKALPNKRKRRDGQ